MIRTLNWFEGIGGFRYGLERANPKEGVCGQPDSRTRRDSSDFDVSQQDGEPSGGHGPEDSFSCVGACEIDRYARSVYAHNFGHEPEWADSLTVDVQSLPDHDLFTAGFPCQAFSVAGKRGGFSDTRGTLFFEICRILGAKRPRLVLLENVKGLLSHDRGRTFLTILESLDELGYDCQWEVLNSKNYGVPQNRERVFIIGHLRGTSKPQVFPLGEDGLSPDSTRRNEGEEVTNTLKGRACGGGGYGDVDMPIVAMTAYGNSNRKDSRVQETDTFPCLDGSQAYAVGTPELRKIGNIDQKGHNSIWGRVYDPEGLAPTISSEGLRNSCC